MIARILAPLIAIQAILGMRVIARLLRTARGTTIQESSGHRDSVGDVSVIVPVLNEEGRLQPCLQGLIAQGDEVAEILVVDGGSTDGTPALIEEFADRDARVRLVDASPIPSDWNGKAWGLQAGLDQARSPFVLTIDADVRANPALVRSLLDHADTTGLDVLSVATRQEIDGIGEGLLHPSMLTTLVYRFGIPGGRYRTVSDVQANGQCFLARRSVLEQVGGFAAVHDSICEDITLARRIVEHGHEVGFFEAGDLVAVRMYSDWRETWRNWPRSLPMRDRYFGIHGAIGLVEVLTIQALPLPILAISWMTRGQRTNRLASLNLLLLVTRLGILAGTARAYDHRPITYWLSPLADMPVAVRLITSALQRQHTWRGRILVRGGNS